MQTRRSGCDSRTPHQTTVLHCQTKPLTHRPPSIARPRHRRPHHSVLMDCLTWPTAAAKSPCRACLDKHKLHQRTRYETAIWPVPTPRSRASPRMTSSRTYCWGRRRQHCPTPGPLTSGTASLQNGLAGAAGLVSRLSRWPGPGAAAGAATRPCALAQHNARRREALEALRSRICAQSPAITRAGAHGAQARLPA